MDADGNPTEGWLHYPLDKYISICDECPFEL